MTTSTITPATFRFLSELARHNDRQWFAANKQRYIDDVRDPLLQFVAEFAPELAKISRHMVADPRPVGGSLFRIYRDTRFSRDKRPYKTQAGLSFRHAGGRDVHGPVFYLHLEPGGVFMAAGMWHPEPEALTKIRDAIVGKPKRWQQVLDTRALRLDAGHEGDQLKRPPRGYDPEHRFVGDLKRKSFTAHTPFADADVCASNFQRKFAAACRQKVPLMEFLTSALGLPW
jgi:uncharacterized protein (TIGR02453 family)